MDKATLQRIANHCLVEARTRQYPNVYVLGCWESHEITISMQQVRAFNLSWALCLKRNVRRDSRVAVVGGGIAGLTAALALASKTGCQVDLYEKRARILTTFADARHRWIHPSIYRYMEFVGQESDCTDFPFLNWKAGYASEVADSVCRSWLAYASSYRIRTCLKTRISLERLVQLTREYDTIVLATGFGSEGTRREFQVPARPYWRSGAKEDYAMRRRSQRARVLISGCGDGGLVELFHFTIRDFKHHDLRSYMPGDWHPHVFKNLADVDAQVGERLNEIIRMSEEDRFELLDSLTGHLPTQVEKAWRTAESKRDRKLALRLYERTLESECLTDLRRAYHGMRFPRGYLAALKKRLRQDTSVFLNSTQPHPYLITSAGVNKLLLYALERAGAFEYIPGRLTRIARLTRGNYSVLFSHAKHVVHFDSVVLRHGTSGTFRDQFKGLSPMRDEDITGEILAVQWSSDHITRFFLPARGMLRRVWEAGLEPSEHLTHLWFKFREVRAW